MLGLDAPCPICKGQKHLRTPDNSLWQMCWNCDGTGRDPGDERFFLYPFVATIQANQLLPNQHIVTTGDAPFRIKMWTRQSTGPFKIQIRDSQLQNLIQGGTDAGGGTNDRCRVECCFGDGSLPFLVVPHPVIPAGQLIIFDLEDVSGAPNTINLAFIGAKVYPSQP